jgi:hypothetical protein
MNENDPLGPSVAIECGGQQHLISVEHGELVALDHDVTSRASSHRAPRTADRAAAATCNTLIGAWGRRRDDPRLLTLLSRGPADTVPLVTRQPRDPGGRYVTLVSEGSGRRRGVRRRTASRAWDAPPGVPAPSQRARPFRLTVAVGDQTDEEQSLFSDAAALAALGRPISARLVGSITERLLRRMRSERRADPHLWDVLHASLYGRAAESVAGWCGDGSVAARLVLDVVDSGNASVKVAESREVTLPEVRLALPLDWVAEVWASDLAIVAGRLSLTVLDRNPERITVESAGWPRADLTAVTIDHGALARHAVAAEVVVVGRSGTDNRRFQDH